MADSLANIVDTVQELVYIHSNTNLDKDAFDFNVILSVFFVGFIVFLAIKAIKIILNEEYNSTYTILPTIPQNSLFLDGAKFTFSNEELHAILIKYQPYYKKLNTVLQKKFLKRLQLFMKSKDYIIHSREGYREMPILLSAAAIQIMFGLRNYLIPHYKFLEIKTEEYFAPNSLRVLAGHVKANSITVAFNQLLKGYRNYEDAENVALHEMAHALYFQKIIVNPPLQKAFIQLFNTIIQAGIEARQTNNFSNFYTVNAAADMQEFWAESVEHFFEQPNELQITYPTIYDTLVLLLKQNPLNNSNPLRV